MAQATTPPQQQHSNAYNIFILVLTVLSLAVMVVLLLPISPQTASLLSVYDNLICVIFLIDFTLNIRASSSKSDYFIKQRGWLDLIGSIPTFGVLRFTALLRLARLSRLARITRLMRGQAKKQLVDDVIKNRSQYAAFITILLTILVLCVSSVLVLQFESKSPDANITTGGDALWYSLVTITTVGYGDYYPVTTLGRITATFIMITGVGIIGALASILSSVLVGGSPAEEPEAEGEAPPGSAPAAPPDPELAAIKDELAALRLMLERIEAAGGTQI